MMYTPPRNSTPTMIVGHLELIARGLNPSSLTLDPQDALFGKVQRIGNRTPGMHDNRTSVEDLLSDIPRGARKKTYTSGTTVFQAGDIANKLFFLANGSVDLIYINSNGKKKVITQYGGGSFFGEGGVFDPEKKRNTDAVTNRKSVIYKIEQKDLYDIHIDHPRIVQALLKQLSRRTHSLDEQIGNITFLKLESRIARILLDLTSSQNVIRNPKGTQIKISRKEIGEFAGCSREMAGRIIQDFVNKGLIEASGKTMVIYHRW